MQQGQRPPGHRIQPAGASKIALAVAAFYVDLTPPLPCPQTESGPMDFNLTSADYIINIENENVEASLRSALGCTQCAVPSLNPSAERNHVLTTLSLNTACCSVYAVLWVSTYLRHTAHSGSWVISSW